MGIPDGFPSKPPKTRGYPKTKTPPFLAVAFQGPGFVCHGDFDEPWATDRQTQTDGFPQAPLKERVAPPHV